jgi:RimJ/RimL family protein N-acetyltransferase
MSAYKNQLGQAIGFPLPDWTARPRPPRTPIAGRFCRVEPFDLARHAAELFAAYSADKEGQLWTYLPYGPFTTLDDYRKFAGSFYLNDDPLFHTIVEAQSGRAVGVASLMRIDPGPGVIEVGGICYSPALQQTPAATEAMFLLMRRAFDELGYRRYEWKCDLLNTPSSGAAKRLGFRFEGIFRQATVYKGRNRDTAWFSILDREWPALKAAYERWLAPDNFDSAGRQRVSLSSLTGPLLEDEDA